MKKGAFLFIGILISLTTLSQNLDNEFYFRFGYSSPSWKQFGMTENDWLDAAINKKVGGTFEIGTIFMINSFPAAKNMALGINADYLYLNYSKLYSSNNLQNINLDHVTAGSKLGPSFTFSPVDKLAFDIYFKAHVAWSSAAVIYEEVYDDAEDFYLGKTTLGYSTGLNIRYGILMLGIEYDSVSPELESDDSPGEYLQEAFNAEFNIDGDSKKSPLPCLNFTLGLSF